MSAGPCIEHFPTGYGKHALCLLVGLDHVWAGLYTTREHRMPAAVGVSLQRHRVRYVGQQLRVGTTDFRVTPRALQRIAHWLRYRGVRVQVES